MKKLFFIISFFAVAFCNAQLSNNWTFSTPANMLPSTYTAPTVTPLTGVYVGKARFVVEVPGSLDNDTMATALAAIGAAARDSVNSQYVEALWGLDVTLDITMKTVFQEIKRGYSEFDFGDFANQYKVGTDVFKLTGYSEWVIEQ